MRALTFVLLLCGLSASAGAAPGQIKSMLFYANSLTGVQLELEPIQMSDLRPNAKDDDTQWCNFDVVRPVWLQAGNVRYRLVALSATTTPKDGAEACTQPDIIKYARYFYFVEELTGTELFLETAIRGDGVRALFDGVKGFFSFTYYYGEITARHGTAAAAARRTGAGHK